MFGLKRKQPTGEKIQFAIDGMHCTSCSLNIDGELEDQPGVMSASTSYAKSVTTVEYDPAKVSPKELTKVITGLGYSIK
ncbi:heavy-metal-associated domain-containing protein [Candidatus Woesebacteria bacterium]|nr:heavy-metal-associated domain-containing protein [Candidatus Woesebacteria bacterium]